MVFGHLGQDGVIVQWTVMVVNEHVHVCVMNLHPTVMVHLAKDRHHNRNHVIRKHALVLHALMVKF